MLLFLLCWAKATAQWSSEVEPITAFKLKRLDGYVKINMEGQTEERIGNGVDYRHDFAYLEPLVGLDMRGYIYHPNLLEFHFNPELGDDLQVGKQDQQGKAVWTNSLLQYYNLRINLMRAKSFATNIFAEQGRSQRDLDFFSRARVDSTRLGGHTGYGTGKFIVSLDALHLDETVSSNLGRDSATHGNTVSLQLDRTNGSRHKTDLSYELNTYTRYDGNLFQPMTGDSQTADLRDTLRLGADEWFTLNSSGMYNRLSSENSLTRNLNLRESAGLRLRPNLSSDLDANYSNLKSLVNRTDGSTFRASLRHQLYSSLTSTLTLEEESQKTRSRDTRIAEHRSGAVLSEGYTKQLPMHSMLTLTANWRADRVQRRTTGQQLSISDEPLILHDIKPAFLSQLYVVDVGRVTSPIGVTYLETLDYLVIWHGTMVEIRRVAGGNIPENGNVLVSYTATALPSDSYVTYMQSYYGRLDLFNGLLGIYARVNRIDNSGGQSTVLRELAEKGYGTEVRWRWCTVGAERDVQHSNLSPFSTTRVYQSSLFDLGSGSLLTLDLEQSWSDYPDRQQTREGFSAIGRYRRQLGLYWNWEVDGGLMRERGQGFDQDRKVARTALSFGYGMLNLSLSYDFEDETLSGERHRRHHFLLQAKRRI
jgi:hypothetical protein